MQLYGPPLYTYPAQRRSCRPAGYQPKRYNPGSLKFSMYDYPFQTVFGRPYHNVGCGWYRYETTGKY